MNFEAFVYKWLDKATGKVYIGYHKGKENDSYICSGKYMLQEYLQRPFDFYREIIFRGNCKDCYEYEQAEIQKLLKSKIPCYNKGVGGTWNIDDDVKAKISASLTGNKNHNWGRKFSETTRIKISLARIGKPFNVGENNPMFGKKQSENHKKWMHENMRVRIKTSLGEFDSVTLAAKAHGVAQPTMSMWLKKGKASRV